MSRYYDVQYQIKTKNPDPIKQKIYEDYVHDGQDEYENGILTIDGTCNLAGGMSEEACHEELVALVKTLDSKAKVVSRWHSADWMWDDEFGDDLDDKEE